eukprot:GHVT01048143.1.p1 GENE.GHVT01048143.1~~GHVT01048143.1.p1  ORF type:complete len:186 (-),score=11.14 GHVT01048143.1:2437-2994(-)
MQIFNFAARGMLTEIIVFNSKCLKFTFIFFLIIFRYGYPFANRPPNQFFPTMRPTAASMQGRTPWSAARFTRRNRGRFRANCMAAIGFGSVALLVFFLPSQTKYALAIPPETGKDAPHHQTQVLHYKFPHSEWRAALVFTICLLALLAFHFSPTIICCLLLAECTPSPHYYVVVFCAPAISLARH